MRRVCVVVSLLATLAVVLGAPVDSTTDISLEAAHNETVMSSVCMDMMPDHYDSPPQVVIAPYAIYIQQRKASPGNNVYINIYGRGGEQFTGVYIQGRYNDTPVGEFVPPGAKSPPVTISDCPPGKQNAVSYISKKPISQLTLQYAVPDVPEIYFVATFVKSYSAFWTGVKSDRLEVLKAEDLVY